MSNVRDDSDLKDDNRRQFIRGSSLFLASALPSTVRGKATEVKPELRVGLIGCGRSGVGQLKQALLMEDVGVRVVALADMFPDKLQQCARNLKGRFPTSYDVEPSSRFVGLDAFERLLRTEMDLVILAACATFRPLHAQAALQYGRNTFVLHPMCTDEAGAAGIVSYMQAAQNAGIFMQIGLSVPLSEVASERIRAGVIGDLTEIAAEISRPTETERGRFQNESEFESRLRNSSRHASLTGHPAIRQHVENLHIASRLLQSEPCHAEVITHRVGAAVDFASRIRFGFCNGAELVSNCRVYSERPGRRQIRAVGTAGQYDLLSHQLLNETGQVVKRFGQSVSDESSTLRQMIRSIANNEKPENSTLIAQSHLLILKALDRFQDAEGLDNLGRLSPTT